MGTKHCCYGLCNSDSRYYHKDYMQEVKFYSFPKLLKQAEKCARWVRACSRVGFTTASVTKHTYICSKHFVDGSGPTCEFPDPVPVGYDANQVRFYRRHTTCSIRACTKLMGAWWGGQTRHSHPPPLDLETSHLQKLK